MIYTLLGRLNEMSKISGRDIDPRSIPTRSAGSGYEQYIKNFMASNAKAQEVFVPEGIKAWSVYSSLARIRKKLNLVGKLIIRVDKCDKVYISKI